MKTKYVKNKTQFNIRVNEQEYEIIRKLKDEHALNISQLFKIHLKSLLEKYENRM